MRLTIALCKQRPHVLYRLLMKQRRSLKPHEYAFPEDLIAKKVPLYDAYKFSKEREPVDFSKYIPPTGKNLQPESVYSVPVDVKLTEGDAQVQLLTNSLYHKDMPPAYIDQFEKTSVTDSEYAWMTSRFETMKHDSFQIRLPKEYMEKYHWIAKARPYGPPVERRCRQISLILNDFVRVSSDDGAPKPTLNDLTCQFLRPGEKVHLFQGRACSATLSSKPLPLVGNPAVTGSLPSMYPAAPEMDLEKTFDYDPKTIFPILPTKKEYSLHTIYVNHPYDTPRTRQERSGIALLQTFAFAAARAATAKKPLVLQTIYHDEKNLDFVVMQLNTLSNPSEKEDDNRNEIWHLTAPLKEEDEPQSALNRSVLKWLKVFYAR